MDLFGVQLLVGIVLTVLIVFPGILAPAHKRLLDSIVGRLIAIATVIFATQIGGWPIGVLAATAVLVLTPNTMREGFVGSDAALLHEGFGSAERPLAQNSRTGVEGFMLAKQASSPNAALLHEGFGSAERPLAQNSRTGVEGFNGANKIQVVPKERRERWFIEQVMNEKPRVLETDVASTEAVH